MDQKNRTDVLHNIEEKVLCYIEEQGLLAQGERVLAGVSGGADSICLLFILLKLKERFDGNLTIEVVHVHHMLRGEEADGDLYFVQQLCEQEGLVFHAVRCPVAQIAKEQSLSIEEAGRHERYRSFEKIRRERGLDKIAVAHHKNDQAETILMHLFRGSGIRGMAGIAPARGCIIHPLLPVSRAEIEQYLSDRMAAYRTDATNGENQYTRNRVRNELLPYIESHINSKAVEHIAAFGAHAGEIDRYFQKKADNLFDKYGTREENRVILCLDCLAGERLELTFLVRRCLEHFNCGLKDIGQEHIMQIIQLMHARSGAAVSLPGGIIVQKVYENLYFEWSTEHKADTEPYSWQEIGELEENLPQVVGFAQTEYTFLRKKIKKNETFPKKKYTKWFDYDKIKGTLRIRTRQAGDSIVVNAAGGRKKLKDYFIDSKLPRQERTRIPLLADGSDILWIVGMRMSEAYKVDGSTTAVLEVICQMDEERKQLSARSGRQ